MGLINKTIGSVLFCLAITVPAWSQVDPAQIFSNSYRYEASGDYQKAISELTVLNGYDYHKSLRLGWLYYLAKDYGSSEKYYNQAIGLAPQSVEALLGLCAPLEAQKKTDDLEAAYKKILSLDKSNSKINDAIGNINYYRKDFAQAEKYYDLVQSMYPFDYYSNLMCAWTKYFLGKKNDAQRLFNIVLIISPTDQSAKDGLNLLK